MDPSEDVSPWRLFSMTIYWFSYMAQWAPVLFILIPLQISFIVDYDQKATYLALLVMCGGIVTLVISPLIGALSDRLVTARYGISDPPRSRFGTLLTGCLRTVAVAVALALVHGMWFLVAL